MEVDLAAPRQRLGRRLAQKIRLAGLDGVKTVGRSHWDIDDLKLVETEVAREMLRDGAAEVDHEAGRLGGLILVGERRRVVAHRETDRLRLFHRVERCGTSRTQRQRRGRQGARGEAEKTDSE